VPIVVVEENRDLVEGLRGRGIPAVSGDAADPAVLIQGHVARADTLVLAVPDVAGVRRMVQTARALNPSIEILLRSHSDAEGAMLVREGLGTVYMGEHELARAMIQHILERVKPISK
jgi:CPA2 family monovalent cation:H+ antiporter-2